MSAKETMTNDLLKKIKGYFMQLNLIKDSIYVWIDIHRYFNKFQHSPNFLLTIQNALSEAYSLGFMRLFDNNKKAQSMFNLIDKCIKNIDLFPNQIETTIKLEEYQKKFIMIIKKLYIF